MTDFMAKMHQIRFRLGLRPRPTPTGIFTAPTDLLAVFGGLLLREGEGRGGQGRVAGRRAFPLFLFYETTTVSYSNRATALCQRQTHTCVHSAVKTIFAPAPSMVGEVLMDPVKSYPC